jgi:hypothetical protein
MKEELHHKCGSYFRYSLWKQRKDYKGTGFYNVYDNGKLGGRLEPYYEVTYSECCSEY